MTVPSWNAIALSCFRDWLSRRYRFTITHKVYFELCGQSSRCMLRKPWSAEGLTSELTYGRVERTVLRQR